MITNHWYYNTPRNVWTNVWLERCRTFSLNSHLYTQTHGVSLPNIRTYHPQGCNSPPPGCGRSGTAGRCRRWSLPCTRPCMSWGLCGQSHRWLDLHTSPDAEHHVRIDVRVVITVSMLPDICLGAHLKPCAKQTGASTSSTLKRDRVLTTCAKNPKPMH